MTIRTVPGTDLRYYLIAHDRKGRERTDDPEAPDGRLSGVVRAAVADTAEPITDVFFTSHGWKGDIPAAIRQYDAWIGAMAALDADRAAMEAARPGFRSLVVGLHWPSLPWGDEDHAPAGASFDVGAGDPLADTIEAAADAIADTEKAREALRTIFASAMEDPEPDEMPAEVAAAYETLFREAGLAAAGPDAPPGEDAEEFDPAAAYARATGAGSEFSFGGGLGGGLLSPLRQLSFWKMKKRARLFGEAGAATLLRDLMTATSGRDVRFHIMGHSFGCIVASAAVAGAGGDAPLPRPVSSLYLVQGALSLWSYCQGIPHASGHDGYFHSVVSGGKVEGPILTTRSEHDSAVCGLYPLAAGVARQVDYAPGELPKYGGVGEFGLQGPALNLTDLGMRPLAADYGFEAGRVYNLECRDYINQGGGLSGAHNDIAKPEVAHAFWAAARPGA